jgi:malic enzyme
LAEVHGVSAAVAEAVALVAVAEGLATCANTPAEALERLRASHWQAEYPPIFGIS